MNARSALAILLVAGTAAACGGDAKEAAKKGSTQPVVQPRPTEPDPVPSRQSVPPLKLKSKSGAKASGGEGAQLAWPTFGTAGVPNGRRLARSGPLRIKKNGTVIDGRLIHGEISIEADNVTIRNSHIVGEGGDWVIIQRKGHSGLRVERTEINGNGRTKSQAGILNFGGTLTVRAAYIHTVSDGVNTDQGLVEDSIIMGLKRYAGDHNDAIAAASGPAPGTSLVIRHNVILNPLNQTSAIALFQDFGRAHDVTVQQNYLAGGGYTLYGGKGKHGRSSNIRVIGNVFSTRYHKKGGYYGPVTAFDPSGPGNLWRGNIWDNGKPVNP
ncbi:right-handed parallel beta-helix repeat-containing protein [Actinomadura macrotermitis]|uniref:Right handed beta helix domain-containing protein n=1 Tax=Actinomadura macrotermitis TaxID=2585200 RepID=A0A7K0BQM7_9ACTN|nr:hypothetical protein [Actinomadura macrotermitis]MQY03469.1 hypothetical protein [Actinomadura macrotermitis]